PISPLMPPSFYPSDILDIFTPLVILLFVVIIGSLASVAVIATKKRKAGPPSSALEHRLTPPQIEAPPLPPTQTVALALPERITCPKCQYQNIIGLRYCVNCGEILSREVLQQRFCIFCGRKVESSFKFCINCGKELFKKEAG
ncbi:MAG: zinc ribbon domain-containing protein, partial [Candidatus Thermoplasmatota archaeon]|nr:zinc ribbon domain-containing protein [Candidatus Thermoplasmatota archaeon]